MDLKFKAGDKVFIPRGFLTDRYPDPWRFKVFRITGEHVAAGVKLGYMAHYPTDPYTIEGITFTTINSSIISPYPTSKFARILYGLKCED